MLVDVNLKAVFIVLMCTATVLLIVMMHPRQKLIFEPIPQEIRIPLTSQLQSVALELSAALELRWDTHESRRHTESALKQIVRTIGQMKAAKAASISGDTGNVKERVKRPLLDVCPDVYLGPDKGHVMSNCTNVRRFESVVSILLNGFDYDDPRQVIVLLRDIDAAYPRLTVHLAVREKLSIPSDLMMNLIQHVLTQSTTPGDQWNELARQATTDYVLIGRRIERFQGTGSLERMVRVVSESSVDVVGGALRTSDGHWSLGCQQSRLRNYTLTYVLGYYMSASSCAYCDYVPSPFVCRTSTLRKFNLGHTSRYAVFHEFFLRLRNHQQLLVVCPDAMFYVLPDDASYIQRHAEWGHIARQLKLNRVKFPDGTQLSYSCTEVELNCKCTAGIIMPICCLESLVTAIHFVMDMCDDIGMYCRTLAGTTLGAVKFNGVIPWEMDADIAFRPMKNTSIWWQRHRFATSGYKLEIVYKELCPTYDTGNDNCEAFALECPSGWSLDIYGSADELTCDTAQDPLITPTKVLLAGRWMNSNNNPGLYAHNHYGYATLKHCEHRKVRHDQTTQLAIGGEFERCPSQGSHFCLDEYIPDGNIDLTHP